MQMMLAAEVVRAGHGGGKDVYIIATSAGFRYNDILTQAQILLPTISMTMSHLTTTSIPEQRPIPKPLRPRIRFRVKNHKRHQPHKTHRNLQQIAFTNYKLLPHEAKLARSTEVLLPHW